MSVFAEIPHYARFRSTAYPVLFLLGLGSIETKIIAWVYEARATSIDIETTLASGNRLCRTRSRLMTGTQIQYVSLVSQTDHSC